MSITRIKSYGLSDGAVTTEKISNNVSLGVKISNIQIANSAYSVLNDTAIALEGGYLVITGAGFAAGCQVIVGANTATSTTFVNSTTIRAQVGAADAGTKTVYVVNTDGGTAIRVNGLTYSATPTWVTSSTLNNQLLDSPFNVSLSATGASSYQLQSGSTLPPGTTLLSNGYFYGTVTGITEPTTYNFTIEAIDDENQESPRTFSLIVNTFNTNLYITAESNISDITGNYTLSVTGVTRTSTAYLGSFGMQFGSGRSIEILSTSTDDYWNLGFNIGGTQVIGTFEAAVYPMAPTQARGCIICRYGPGEQGWTIDYDSSGNFFLAKDGAGGGSISGAASVTLNTWQKIAFVYYTVGEQLKVDYYKNNSFVGTGILSGCTNSPTNVRIGARRNSTELPFVGHMDEIKFWRNSRGTY